MAPFVVGIPQGQADSPPLQTPPQRAQGTTSKPSPRATKSIKYLNTKYGFAFSLPKTWKGYSIVEGTWEGGDNDRPQGYKVLERGPSLIIVNPQSTSGKQYQDIYIMVFSHLQWDSLHQGKFSVSAGPIGPGELGRNRTYVFALPPRMVNDSLYGWDEVMKIMQSNPCMLSDENTGSKAVR